MDNLFEKFIAGVSSKVTFAVEARKRYTRNDVASYFIGLPSVAGRSIEVAVEMGKITDWNFNEMTEGYANKAVELYDATGELVPKFSLSRELVSFILLNPEYNKHYLKDVTTVGFNNLVLAPVCCRQKPDDNVLVLCNDNICKMIGLDIEKDYDEIVKTTLKNNPVKYQTLVDILQIEMDADDLYVVTSDSGYLGAATAALAGVRELAADVGSDFFVFPSSIHELICVKIPITGFTVGVVDELKQMVKTVNRQAVGLSDLLSDDVYLYRAGTDTWEVL